MIVYVVVCRNASALVSGVYLSEKSALKRFHELSEAAKNSDREYDIEQHKLEE